jgi:hypothetical protein
MATFRDDYVSTTASSASTEFAMNTNAAVVLRRILERSNPCGAGSRDGILESRDEDDEDLVEKTKHEAGKREWFDERSCSPHPTMVTSTTTTDPLKQIFAGYDSQTNETCIHVRTRRVDRGRSVTPRSPPPTPPPPHLSTQRSRDNVSVVADKVNTGNLHMQTSSSKEEEGVEVTVETYTASPLLKRSQERALERQSFMEEMKRTSAMIPKTDWMKKEEDEKNIHIIKQDKSRPMSIRMKKLWDFGDTPTMTDQRDDNNNDYEEYRASLTLTPSMKELNYGCSTDVDDDEVDDDDDATWSSSRIRRESRRVVTRQAKQDLKEVETQAFKVREKVKSLKIERKNEMEVKSEQTGISAFRRNSISASEMEKMEQALQQKQRQSELKRQQLLSDEDVEKWWNNTRKKKESDEYSNVQKSSNENKMKGSIGSISRVQIIPKPVTETPPTIIAADTTSDALSCSYQITDDRLESWWKEQKLRRQKEQRDPSKPIFEELDGEPTVIENDPSQLIARKQNQHASPPRQALITSRTPSTSLILGSLSIDQRDYHFNATANHNKLSHSMKTKTLSSSSSIKSSVPESEKMVERRWTKSK